MLIFCWVILVFAKTRVNTFHKTTMHLGLLEARQMEPSDQVAIELRKNNQVWTLLRSVVRCIIHMHAACMVGAIKTKTATRRACIIVFVSTATRWNSWDDPIEIPIPAAKRSIKICGWSKAPPLRCTDHYRPSMRACNHASQVVGKQKDLPR
jgi:hypothetical protein